MSHQQVFSQTLWDQFKLSLFNIAFQIIGQNNQSLQTTYMLSVIQFIQLIYFPFQIQIQFAWHNAVISGEIQKFLLLNQQKTSTYLFGMYCAVSVVFFTAMLVLLCGILKQFLNNQYLIVILNIALRFIMTVGFAEILRLHLGFLVCKRDSNGQLKMLYTTDQECWSDTYIIHACIVIFSITILYLIVVIGSKLFIDARNNKKNAFSQREGSTYSFMFVYVSLSMLLYSIVEQPKYSILVILIQFQTSFVFFYKVHFKKPFYNRHIQKLWSVISGLVFYTNFMLLVAYTFEHLIFVDTMKGWIVTMPMLLVILCQDEKQSINLLKANMIEQLSSQEIIQLSEFLVELCESCEKDKNMEILLLGFLEVHQQTCLNPQCAIKTSVELSKKFRDNVKYSDKRMILTEIIDQIYQLGIQAYPLNVDLKLHYSYFLLYKLEQGQKALIEVDKAEMGCPSFGQKIIDETYSKSQDPSNQVKYIQTIDRSMKYQYTQIKKLVEECTYLKISFWSIIQDETPNLSQLQEYGNQILQSIYNLKKQLFKFERYNPLNMQVQRLIEKFSKYVHQLDNQKYNQIALKKKKILAQQSEHQYLKNQEELSSYSYPVIVLELFGKPNQPTIIKNINQAFHSLLGYSKTDVIGRPLSLILQSTYLKLHSIFVESYFSQLRTEQIYETQERSQFMISKSKYVLQTYSTNSIYTSDKGIFQFCRLRLDQHYNNCAYLIFNLDGKIESISASCISVLNLDIRLLQIKQLTIQKLFPFLMYNKDDYMNKMNLIVFENQTNSLNKSSDFDEKQDDQCISQLYYAQLYEIQTKSYQSFSVETRPQIFGYYLKVQVVETSVSKENCLIKRNKLNHQFKYSVGQNAYICTKFIHILVELVSQSTSQYESIKNDSEQQDEPKVCMFSQQSFPRKKGSLVTNFKQGLGHDIKTLRLFQGEIKEIIDLDQDEEEEEQIREKTQKLQLDEQQEQTQNIKICNQEDLLYHLLNVPYSSVIKKIIFVLNSLLILMFCIAIVMYIVIIDTQSRFESAINLLAVSNQRFASILKIQSNLQDLRGCYLNLEQYTQKSTGGKYIAVNYLELSKELDVLLESDKILTQANIQINSNYKSIVDEFQSPILQMFTKDDQYQNFTFNQAIEQMISKAITLNNSDISNFIDENEDFHYYLHNTLNAIPKFQIVSQAYYYSNIQSLIDNLNIEEHLFFTIQLCCLSLIVLFFQIYIHFQQKLLKTIISLFLEIRENQIKNMINQFQIFIQLLQLSDHDEIESLEEEEENEAQDEKDYYLGLTNKFKKRKSVFVMKNYRKIQISFFFYLGLLVSYFSYLYISSTIITDQTNSLVPLVNLTSFMPTQYRLIDNSIKEMLYDENAILFNEMNSNNKLTQELEYVKLLDAELHILNQKNELILSDQYKDVFNDIYIQNPCDIIISNDPSVNSTACLNFNKDILQEGLAVAITNFFENAEYMLEQYSFYDKNAVYDNLTYDISQNHRTNYSCNIYNTKIGNANRKMQKVFIRICHMQLLRELQNYLNQHYQNLQLQFTLLFMIFCMLSIFVYFIIWIPLQSKFYNQTKRAREIQSLIPIDLFNNCQALQEYLRYIKENT